MAVIGIIAMAACAPLVLEGRRQRNLSTRRRIDAIERIRSRG